MDIGRLDVCLAVSSLPASVEFYQKLGFTVVEGQPEDGWAVLTNGEARLGLFAASFMDGFKFSLNFRGADVSQLTSELSSRGIRFDGDPKLRSSGAGTARIIDPDGNLIFLDSTESEVAARHQN